MKTFWLLTHSLLARLAVVCAERYLFFGSCSDEGWICSELEGGKIDLDYTCSDDVGWDVSFREESFILPPTIHSLKITKCLQVNAVIDFVSTEETFNLNALILSHIYNLTFVENYKAASPPRSIILEDVGIIPSLPSYVFLPSSGLWDSIVFQNVTIGRVASEAFENLTLSTVFIWDNVRVNIMNSFAMRNILLPEGEMIFHECSFGRIETYSLQVHAPNVVMKNCFIGEIAVHGIGVIADKFIFENNSGLELVQFQAFDVQARETLIIGNSFHYLQVKALEAIQPFLWHNSHDGEQNVTYEFRDNRVTVADPGALHVNLLAYIKVGGVVLVEHNTFDCSCEHLGWLGVLAAPGSHHRVLQDFHQVILSEQSQNLCLSNCSLPLGILEHLIADPKLCAANLTGEQLCLLYHAMMQPRRNSAVILASFCSPFMKLVFIVFATELAALLLNI